jgi:peroxiredoxin
MRLLWITVPVSLVMVGLAIWMFGYQPTATSSAVNIAAEPRHPVTDEMATDADARTEKLAPDFELVDSEGVPVSLAGMLEKGPVVVVMTKDGCPCSIESQQFFNTIHTQMEGKVNFVGIIDAEQPQAQLYKRSLSVPYPLLVDEEKAVLREFESKQSVYVYFIRTNGRIAKVWPGYNRAMLVELNEMAANEAGLESIPFDMTMAPTELSSGCFFFKPDEWVED